MVHDPSVALSGNSRDLRGTAEILDQIGSELGDLYVAKSRLPKAEVQKLMADESYLSADRAKELGFADEVFAQAKLPTQTLLDRIAALEGEIVQLKTSEAPATAKSRKLESVTRTAAAELSAERRATATAASYVLRPRLNKGVEAVIGRGAGGIRSLRAAIGHRPNLLLCLNLHNLLKESGRGGQIRTDDILLPNRSVLS